MNLHSIDLDCFTNVIGGQQLAIRPDLVPPVVLKELQKLCDSVRPVPDEIALQLLREELEIDDLSEVFGNLHLVASASLGQVYQAELLLPPPTSASGSAAGGRTQRPNNNNGNKKKELVAIKVQRPGMRKSFSLDLFLLQQWGDFMDGFTSIFTQQVPYHRAFFDAFAHGSYSVRKKAKGMKKRAFYNMLLSSVQAVSISTCLPFVIMIVALLFFRRWITKMKLGIKSIFKRSFASEVAK
jgi:hypothetical protein